MAATHPDLDLDPSVEAHLARLNPAHAVTCSREFRTFHNALRILLNLDACDLIEAGAIEDQVEHRRFMDDPLMFFVRASDPRAAAIWAAIQKRQPEALRVALPDGVQMRAEAGLP